MDKKQIIKKAIRGRSPLTKTNEGPNYPSKASRGIYQSGPWSDSLATTHVKIDRSGIGAKTLRTVQGPPVSGSSKIIGGGKGGIKITFPELKEAEETLKNKPRYERSRNGYLRQMHGVEKSTFGGLLKNTNFRKQLRSLQEKYKISGYA